MRAKKLSTMLVAVALVSVISPTRARAADERGGQWALDRLAIEVVHRDVTGSGIVVAVVDTAIAAGHNDLVGKMVDGYDFVTNRPIDVQAVANARSSIDHGTMVAGIIAADADGDGITGIAPGARIMPVRVVADDGQGSTVQLAAGIRWAVDNGADVINVSIRSTTDSAGVRSAVDHAVNNGVIVVASAGNTTVAGPFYPASLPNVIAVGASDVSGAHYAGSPVSAAVEVVAPGADIITASGIGVDQYQRGWGTSFAAPHVSGVVAIMREIAPQATLGEVREALHRTARDLGAPGRDDTFGYGELDAVGALMWIDRRNPEPPTTSTISATATELNLEWTPSPSFDVLKYEIVIDGRVVGSVEGSVTAASVPRPAAETATVSVRAVDASGRSANDPATTVQLAAIPVNRAGISLVASSGRVVSSGSSVPFSALTVSAVGSAPAPNGGYWLVDATGRVTPRAGATWLGDGSNLRLRAPVVGMAPTPRGDGYWLVSADGGVFAFGAARFAGSVAGMNLAAPVVGIASSPTGQGYWLVGADGGVFALGDARFAGSAGSYGLVQPVVSITATGTGYLLLGADGGVFSFSAPFYGSASGSGLEAVALVVVPGGYTIIGAEGRVRSFGAATATAGASMLPGETVVGILQR